MCHSIQNKLSKNFSPWSQGRKTPSEGKERTTYSPFKEKAKRWYKKYLEKATASPNKQKEKRKKKREKKNAWLSGRLRIEGRSNGGPRLQRKHKDENGQNKTNATPEKDVMTSANQTPKDKCFCCTVISLTLFEFPLLCCLP